MAPTRGSLLMLAIAVGCLAAMPTTGSAGDSSVPSCVHARPQARYLGFAWDHIVTIRNDCKAAAACRVSTNVNPGPIDVSVPSKQTRNVLTFRASPSREFTYELACSLASRP